MTLVLDASAAAAVLFREPVAHKIAEPLFAARSVVVPQIFELEIANVGRSKVRQGFLSWKDAEALLKTMKQWPCKVLSVSWNKAWILSRKTGLTVYDAAYLALLGVKGRRLLSLDRALVRASESLG